MRTTMILGAWLALTTASVAYAQEAPYSHTLDEQRQRVNQGETAVPAPWEKPATATSAAAMEPSAGSAIESEGSGAIPDLPLEAMTSNGTTYITGGIGDEEKAQLMSQKTDYNFHLLMTATGGAFVSEVHLTITGSGGVSALDITGAGPYVYARLQPGTYTVVAKTSGGEARQVKVKVPARGAANQQIVFTNIPGLTTVHAPTATVD